MRVFNLFSIVYCCRCCCSYFYKYVPMFNFYLVFICCCCYSCVAFNLNCGNNSNVNKIVFLFHFDLIENFFLVDSAAKRSSMFAAVWEWRHCLDHRHHHHDHQHDYDHDQYCYYFVQLLWPMVTSFWIFKTLNGGSRQSTQYREHTVICCLSG